MDAPNTASLRQKHGKLVKVIVGFVVLLVLYAATALGINVVDDLQNLYAPVPPGYYRVLSVADGDTFEVSMDGVKEDIRLVGVDTPETHHPSKPVQCYGHEASDYTKSLIENAPVRLQSDTKQPNRDKYNRLLRYVYLEDGRELNELLVSEGYALATDFNTEKKAKLKTLEDEAEKAKKGLWGKCQVSEVNGIEQTNGVSGH